MSLARFFWQLVRHPKSISAVAPSSKALALQMVSEITDTTGHIVEIGAGTGVITRQILAAGVPPQNLSIVEMNPAFCAALRQQFPACHVLEMDAQELGSLEIKNVGMVISGLPLLSIPEPVQRNIITGAFELMGANGKLVQFTYGPKPPIAEDVREGLGLQWRTLKKIWFNLPPAMPYVFSKK